MKANWLTLTKVHLAGITGINRVRFSKDGKEKRKVGIMFALIAFLGILLIAFVSLYAVLFANSGLNYILPALSFSMAAIITFVFSLLRGPHMLFAMKDYDMLMSLPVKKSDIILSRLITSYTVNLIFCAAVMIPSIVVHFIFGGFSALTLLWLIIALLLCPVIPLALSDVIGTLITAATMKMRHKAVFQTVLALLALVVLLCISFLISFSTQQDTIEISPETLNTMLLIYPPAWLLQQTLTGNGIWYILILIAASVAVAAAFIALLSKFYLSINSALLSKSATGKFDLKHLKAKSPFGALVKNEFARLLSSPAYLLNATAGLMLLVLASIATIFFNPFGALENLPDMPPEGIESMKYMLILMVALMIGLNSPAASSLSLEGTRRWIPFSLPVTDLKILLSKITMSLILTGGVGIISAAILTFTAQLSVLQTILMFSTVIVYALFSSLFGMFLNTKFPKYDWTSETAVVKNSAPVTISVLVGMVLPLAFLLAGAMLFHSFVLPLAILDGLAFVLSVLFFFLLKKTKLNDK